MNSKILVAYGTKYGATAEIAQAIGQVLTEAGQTADVVPADQVHDLTPYTAVVVGSAVYAGNWRKEAVAFLKQHEGALALRPTWLFSSGPTGEGDPVDMLHGWRFPEEVLPIVNRIEPRDIVVFHGKIDPDTLNLGERLLVKAIGARVGDYRNWDNVTSWASDIARDLSPA